MAVPVLHPSLAGALICMGLLLWSPGCGAARQPTADNRTSDEIYRDCSDLPSYMPSGVYTLRPGVLPLDARAYCDMDQDEGGWTVVLRRKDIEPRKDFQQDWESYKWGIGELEEEFYWGNEYLFMLTSQLDREYQVHFWLEDFDGNTRHALYQNFAVESEAAYYKLQVGAFSGGDADDSFSGHRNHSFTTYDNEHDPWSGGNCASYYRGGWWYRENCFYCKLTGEYFEGGNTGDTHRGIEWLDWRSVEPYSLKSAVMKIKPSMKS